MWKIWIVLGVFSWLIGFIGAGRTLERGSLLNKVYVRPPFWIYLICGLPKASNIPPGVMGLLALVGQLQGILLIVFGAIYYFWPNQNFMLYGSFLLLGISLLYVYGSNLYKRHRYKAE